MFPLLSRRSQRVLKLLLIVGLITILLQKMMSRRNNKAGNLNRSVIDKSEYSKYSDFVIAQARHESANFTSNVYKRNNNPFGMKVPRKRKFLGSVGTLSPEGDHYARYDNDTQAFEDFLIWLRSRRFPTNLSTVEEYSRAMKAKGYYGAPEHLYTNALRKWLKYEEKQK